MKNIHLKNLNEEKMLKELTKNPKSYLNYIFSQSANEIYSTSHEFKKLPIIKEFQNVIQDELYKCTKKQLITKDKIIDLIVFEHNYKYNNNFKSSFYQRNEIVNIQIITDLLIFNTEHELLKVLFNEQDAKFINKTLNDIYKQLTIQLGAKDPASIKDIIKTSEINDKENDTNYINELKDKFKHISTVHLNNLDIDNIKQKDKIKTTQIKVLLLNNYNSNNAKLTYYKITKISANILLALKKINLVNFNEKYLKN